MIFISKTQWGGGGGGGARFYQGGVHSAPPPLKEALTCNEFFLLSRVRPHSAMKVVTQMSKLWCGNPIFFSRIVVTLCLILATLISIMAATIYLIMSKQKAKQELQKQELQKQELEKQELEKHERQMLMHNAGTYIIIIRKCVITLYVGLTPKPKWPPTIVLTCNQQSRT